MINTKHILFNFDTFLIVFVVVDKCFFKGGNSGYNHLQFCFVI